MKRNSVLSFAAQIKLNHTIHGALWIAAGVFGLFDNLVCLILSTIMLISALTCTISSLVHKREQSDEMAEANIDKAEAITLDAAHCILLFTAITVTCIPNEALTALDWNSVLPNGLFILLGLLDVITGITFKHLEEEE